MLSRFSKLACAALCILTTGCQLTHGRTALISPAKPALDTDVTWPQDEIDRVQAILGSTADAHRLLERERASTLSVEAAWRWSIAAYSYHESLTHPGNVILLATGERDRTGPIRISLKHNYLDLFPPESETQERVCGPIWREVTERLRESFGDRVTEK